MQVPAELIVKAAVAVPGKCCAGMVAEEVVACTLEVVAVKLAFVCPRARRRLAGTEAALLLLDKNTPAPPDGAAMLSETVPTEEDPPVTDVGLSVKLETVRLASVPHTPGVPPPPQVWPKIAPARNRPTASICDGPAGAGGHVEAGFGCAACRYGEWIRDRTLTGRAGTRARRGDKKNGCSQMQFTFRPAR